MFASHHEKVLAQLSNQTVVIIVNETTDVVGHYVVKALMQPLNVFNLAEYKALLISQEMLSVVNNVTINQFCIRTITSANVEFNNVLGLISDNASYMKKRFKQNLSEILSNAVHITC